MPGPTYFRPCFSPVKLFRIKLWTRGCELGWIYGTCLILGRKNMSELIFIGSQWKKQSSNGWVSNLLSSRWFPFTNQGKNTETMKNSIWVHPFNVSLLYVLSFHFLWLFPFSLRWLFVNKSKRNKIKQYRNKFWNSGLTPL